MSIPFWSNDPTVLFNKAYILEIFPTTDMYYEQKLNSVTRLIIVISLLGYFFFKDDSNTDCWTINDCSDILYIQIQKI